MNTKICTHCRLDLPIDSFRMRKDKSKKYYPNSTCRKCDSLLYKEYRNKNREKVREAGRKWAAKNKDKKSGYDKKYREKVGNSVLYKRRVEACLKNPEHKKTCELCSKEYFPIQKNSKFCSRKCFYLSERETRKEEGNPSYRHGGKADSGQRQMREFKNEFMEEHGYIFCEDCRVSQAPRFDCHHIIFRSEKPRHEFLHDKRNFIILCAKCHKKHHMKKSIRNELVIERGLDKLFGKDVIMY